MDMPSGSVASGQSRRRLSSRLRNMDTDLSGGSRSGPDTSSFKRIEDSEDSYDDTASDDFKASEAFASMPSRRILKEVAISTTSSSRSGRSSGRVNSARTKRSRSTSAGTTAGEQTSEQISEYETPDTSVAVTPAESIHPRRLSHGVSSDVVFSSATGSDRISAASRARELRASKFSLQRGSIKRPHDWDDLDEDDLDVSADAELARVLQEKEYSATDPKRVKVETERLKVKIDDSFDEDDEEGFISRQSTRSDSSAPLARRRPTRWAAMGSPASVLEAPPPRRITRRAAAGGAKAATQELVVLDSDESPLSDLDSELSDLYSDAFESADSLPEEDPADSDANPVRANIRSPPRRRAGVRTTGMTRAERERKKLEKAHPEIATMWEELAAIPKIPPSSASQPSSINRQLKSFQLEGLNWMRKQEQTQWKGGLLGDEMGMGKTIQAVSLIMSDYPAKSPTLVIVPPVALMQWQNEIKDYTDGKLKVLLYHNSNSKVKSLSKKDLKKYDVIMISYSGLESTYRKETKGWTRGEGKVKADSLIHSIHFHRLILDEAHSIKSRTTSVAKACFALKGTYKWCLSGTPVQNRIGEFFSLLRFLEVKPFACYFCKRCKCNVLHWVTTPDRTCVHCKHTGFEHVSVFNQEILNPITSSDDAAVRRQALDKLRLITDRIMLRRVKRDHTASMELPPKEVLIHNEFFGEIERDFASSIMTNTSRKFDTYVSRGVMLNNYANIFGLIMQMRQVANHPDLILKKHGESGQNVLVCSICDEPAEEAIRSRCHHEYCRRCAKDYVRSFEGTEGTPDCARCHIPLSIDFDQPDIEQDEDNVKKNSIINRIKMEDWTSSTKIEMLVFELYKLRHKSKTSKSIVFSQFTSMLQLVEWRLRRAGFNTVMLDGSMSPAQRQRSIEYFMNNVGVEVFLVSLKAGGVALNLTEASRVFIVDPWWNPAAEWQSADRCHRIGQSRPCVITRLCIEDSVESRMVMLQEKKTNMINGTINNDEVALDKLTPEDMQFLFRGS
ncbi:MAG: hypothetical protein M1819_002780 [Sarea resinae]|nr:MAG: hypothetical protein M1819_002780 [Sarea resinae]